MYLRPDSLKSPSYYVPETNKDNANAFYCACDVNTSKSFARNHGGYVRSDIAIINEEQNLQVASQIASRLVQMPNTGSTDKPDISLLASHRSKYCQTPSEMVDWVDGLLSQRDLKLAEKKSEEELIKVENANKERRQKLIDSLSSAERDEVNEFRRKMEIFDDVLNQ